MQDQLGVLEKVEKERDEAIKSLDSERQKRKELSSQIRAI